ncbi:MAG: hypothetical protein M1451_12305, partial [Acidobacteria bacterium]|nr:hypothetical protein [Acidobacteriota bacterium]
MPPFLLAGIILFVPLFWGLILHLMSRLGGWSCLAEDYRSDADMPATRLRMRSAMLRWAHYGNCVTFGVDQRGLHITSFGPLFGHPRLLIPWSDISVTSKKVWFIPCAEFRFRRAPDIHVLISSRLAENFPPSPVILGPRCSNTLLSPPARHLDGGHSIPTCEIIS